MDTQNTSVTCLSLMLTWSDGGLCKVLSMSSDNDAEFVYMNIWFVLMLFLFYF
jgi:hypothetical protein